MTRHAAPSARSAPPRSPRYSLARSCALLGAFGGGAALAAAVLISPASRHPLPAPQAVAMVGQASLATSKQGRVRSPDVAVLAAPAGAAPLAAAGSPAAHLHPARAQVTKPGLRVAKTSRFLAAAIPRPSRPTTPTLLSRMAAVDASAATGFVPTVGPVEELVQVAALATDVPAAVAELAPAAAPRVAAVEEHVETQLPDPRPQSAIAALSQAIDDTAIPLPTARPDRVLPIPPRRRGLPTANVLAYARPDAGIEEPEAVEPAPGPMQGLSRGVAIYDISAATVYLPNGEKLEAHSGLGKMRDDPSQVHQKNRGPTPPHTYDLTMRESLFHGVQAIRLNPIGGQGKIHNRDGLLAHTYMLGKGGDSNGCVSFKDYKRFLAAFKRGDVKRLVVVTSMSRSSRMARPKSLLASLFGSKA